MSLVVIVVVLNHWWHQTWDSLHIRVLERLRWHLSVSSNIRFNPVKSRILTLFLGSILATIWKLILLIHLLLLHHVLHDQICLVLLLGQVLEEFHLFHLHVLDLLNVVGG